MRIPLKFWDNVKTVLCIIAIIFSVIAYLRTGPEYRNYWKIEGMADKMDEVSTRAEAKAVRADNIFKFIEYSVSEVPAIKKNLDRFMKGPDGR